ncbi:DUF2634 domain-containing protein [archaeon]|nr:DUF2634 domain-containing protein [archaeon]
MTYGTSIALNDNFDFNIDNIKKSVTISTEIDNLIQSINLILNINIGENKFYPTYGTDIKSIIGRDVPISYIEHVITKSLLNDPRIISIFNIIATRNGSNVNIDIKFQSNENTVVDLRGIIIW